MKQRDSKGRFEREYSENNYKGYKIYYDKKGYACIWLNGADKKVHILEWEKHNGTKPQGMQIHHKDDSKKNWNIDNLELVTQSDHFKIHAGWLRKKGIWIKKPCKDCKKLLPLLNFYQRKGLTPNQRCIKCSKIYYKRNATPEFRKKRKAYMKEYYKLNRKEKWGVKN